MEKIVPLFFLITLVHSAFSQDTRSEFQITRAVLDKERKTFVGEQMKLTKDQEMVFWPIYEDYEIDRAKFSGKKWEVFKKYAFGYHTLSAAEAKEYLNDIFRYEKRELRLRSKYSKLMSAKISSPVALRFVQIEEYVETRVKYSILEELPFIQP